MNRKIKIRDTAAFIDFCKKMQNPGSGGYIPFEGTFFEILFEDIQPIEGYQPKMNKETGKFYPECCLLHMNAQKSIQDWFDRFPNCCEMHQALLLTDWFRKEDYNDVVPKIIRQLSYTEYLILKRVNNADWYEDITEYFYLNFISFGQLPTGYGVVGLSEYIRHLRTYIESDKKTIPEPKRKRLLAYIENYLKYEEEGKEVNLDTLYETYNKWLELFPFELSDYFGDLKEYFNKNLPFIAQRLAINRYTDEIKIELLSKFELINLLNRTTKNLIKGVDVQKLIANGAISDIDNHRKKISNEKLRITTLQLTERYLKNELDYVVTLKKWLKAHSIYFKEIAPLMKTLPFEKKQKIKPELPKKSISFDSPETIELLFNELKIFFPEKETELKEILNGGEYKELLVFPYNCNSFIEVFRLLNYNRKIINNYTEIRDWICLNFAFQFKKGSIVKTERFKEQTVYDNLKGKAGTEPPKKKRILTNLSWLPYKSKTQLDIEKKR